MKALVGAVSIKWQLIWNQLILAAFCSQIRSIHETCHYPNVQEVRATTVCSTRNEIQESNNKAELLRSDDNSDLRKINLNCK